MRGLEKNGAPIPAAPAVRRPMRGLEIIALLLCHLQHVRRPMRGLENPQRVLLGNPKEFAALCAA